MTKRMISFEDVAEIEPLYYVDGGESHARTFPILFTVAIEVRIKTRRFGFAAEWFQRGRIGQRVDRSCQNDHTEQRCRQ